MKKIITLVFLIQATSGFCGKFHYVVKNSTDQPLSIVATIYQSEKTAIETLDLLPGEQKIQKIKLNVGDRVVFSGNSNGGSNIYLRQVERTYDQMINKPSSLLPNSSPININIIEFFPEVSRTPLNFGELLIETANNKYLNKLLDTSTVKISDKIELGSFLIFKENKLLEAFPATDSWKNISQIKEYNTYTGFQIKRIVKKAGADVNVDVPLIGKLNSSYGNNTMVDYRWFIKNYKEKSWIPKSDNPQTIFTKYPNASGYNTLKNLLETDKAYSKYKVFFVISVSTTDSIKLVADNFVSVDLNVDMNFGLPPTGSKLVKIGADSEFYKSSRFFSGEDKGNIYNYFEVMEISATAIGKVIEELNVQEKKKQEEKLEEIDSLYSQRIEDVQNSIKSTYSTIANSDFNGFDPDMDFELILITPMNKIDQQIKLESISSEMAAEIEKFNADADTYNSYIGHLETKKQTLNNILQDYQNEKLVLLNEQIVNENIIKSISTSTTRKLTPEEVVGIAEFSKTDKD